MNTEAKDHADQSRRTWQSTLDAESRYRAELDNVQDPTIRARFKANRERYGEHCYCKQLEREGWEVELVHDTDQPDPDNTERENARRAKARREADLGAMEPVIAEALGIEKR